MRALISRAPLYGRWWYSLAASDASAGSRYVRKAKPLWRPVPSIGNWMSSSSPNFPKSARISCSFASNGRPPKNTLRPSLSASRERCICDITVQVEGRLAARTEGPDVDEPVGRHYFPLLIS